MSQVEIRVGDWVEHETWAHRGVVASVDDLGPVVRDSNGRERQATRVEWRHCTPDPLPETLPAGTIFFLNDAVRGKCVGPAQLRESRYSYKGDWQYDSGQLHAQSCTGISLIDWPSYHAALHREQDNALSETVDCPWKDPETGEACAASAGMDCSGADNEPPTEEHRQCRLEHARRRACKHARIDETRMKCLDCGLVDHGHSQMHEEPEPRSCALCKKHISIFDAMRAGGGDLKDYCPDCVKRAVLAQQGAKDSGDQGVPAPRDDRANSGGSAASNAAAPAADGVSAVGESRTERMKPGGSSGPSGSSVPARRCACRPSVACLVHYRTPVVEDVKETAWERPGWDGVG